jgi:hypothetical protein
MGLRVVRLLPDSIRSSRNDTLVWQMLKNNKGVHKQIKRSDMYFITFALFFSVYYFQQINFTYGILLYSFRMSK